MTSVKKSHFFLLTLVIFPILIWSVKALAHGTNIQYRQTQAIEIKATYDDDMPMANAQVVVYTPGDPASPWIQGKTDDKGYFIFIPDYFQSGNWEVKVRQSGHGGIISIPLTSSTNPDFNTKTSSGGAGYTSLQKLVMAAVGVWGFVGTALFFSRRKVEQ